MSCKAHSKKHIHPVINSAIKSFSIIDLDLFFLVLFTPQLWCDKYLEHQTMKYFCNSKAKDVKPVPFFYTYEIVLVT